MQAFHCLVKMLQRNPERNYINRHDQVSPEKVDYVKRTILSQIEDCKIVVNDFMPNAIEYPELRRDVSPPFKINWIQLPDGQGLSTVMPGTKEKEEVYGIFLSELSPYCYSFAMVLSDPIEPTVAFRLRIGQIDTNSQAQADHYIWDIISYFLQPFAQAHAMGTVKVNEHVKFKRDGEKILHKIKTVVHVFPKTKRAVEEAEEKYKIDWSHRWAVRGHWREVQGVGKDRAGEYCISGFTWVLDHLKGPEDKIFVEKTRVVDHRFYKKQEEAS